MLTEVKNHLRIFGLSFKYSLMREMVNKASFLSNVIFMVLNNASFLILWLVFFSIKKNIGGYGFDDIMILWGISSGAYGVAHVFFYKSFELTNTISEGKLDAYLVQPKNVLIQSASGLNASALGDLLYAYILLFFIGISLKSFVLYTLFIICGGLILTSMAVIYGSLSFWIGKSEQIANTMNGMMLQFSTYPDTIFNDYIKIIFYTIIPAGFMVYLPVKVIISFSLTNFLIIIGMTLVFVLGAFIIFNMGLRKYSSSNLMGARM